MTDTSENTWSASHRLVNDPDRIRAVEDELIEHARQAGHGASTAFALRLALDEAVRNAFIHGCRNRPGRTIDVAWSVSAESVTMVVNDHGGGFNPEEVADPTTDENLERPCGRGLLLMRAYMSSVEFNEDGNTVTMRYRVSGG